MFLSTGSKAVFLFIETHVEGEIWNVPYSPICHLHLPPVRVERKLLGKFSAHAGILMDSFKTELLRLGDSYRPVSFLCRLASYFQCC
jgi:hypothetical protein